MSCVGGVWVLWGMGSSCGGEGVQDEEVVWEG